MSVASGDLIIYGSLVMPEVDGPAGSGIDTTTRIIFDGPTLINTFGPSYAVVKSDNAGDTSQTGYVCGRLADGTVRTGVYAPLSGLTPETGIYLFDRILKVWCTGSTLRTGNFILTNTGVPPTTGLVMQTGIAGFPLYMCKRPFLGCSSSPSVTVSYYEKCFLKNTNSVNALLGCNLSQVSDPVGDMTFTVSNNQNDNGMTSNRNGTAPSTINQSFDTAAKNIPGTDLGVSSGIGVWLALTLPANTAAINNTYSIQASGQST